MSVSKDIKDERENIIIEQELWDVFKKYPKLSVKRAIFIMSDMIKYLALKA